MCLDQAEKYLLDRNASSGIQRQLLDGEASSPILPPGPVWLQLRDPQPLDHWSEAQFAALYFYPRLAPLALHRVREGLHLPGLLPAIWRLDVLNPNGDLLLSYQFEAEQGRWKITAGHRCQWNECVEAISGEAKVVVNPCPQCKSDMDYCVRWLTAVLLMVANFNSFIIPWIMTGGGPSNASHIWITHIYELAFGRQRWGVASAYSVLLFIILMTFGYFYVRALSGNDRKDGSA